MKPRTQVENCSRLRLEYELTWTFDLNPRFEVYSLINYFSIKRKVLVKSTMSIIFYSNIFAVFVFQVINFRCLISCFFYISSSSLLPSTHIFLWLFHVIINLFIHSFCNETVILTLFVTVGSLRADQFLLKSKRISKPVLTIFWKAN